MGCMFSFHRECLENFGGIYGEGDDELFEMTETEWDAYNRLTGSEVAGFFTHQLCLKYPAEQTQIVSDARKIKEIVELSRGENPPAAYFLRAYERMFRHVDQAPAPAPVPAPARVSARVPVQVQAPVPVQVNFKDVARLLFLAVMGQPLKFVISDIDIAILFYRQYRNICFLVINGGHLTNVVTPNNR